jgi:hypothetical protein
VAAPVFAFLIIALAGCGVDSPDRLRSEKRHTQKHICVLPASDFIQHRNAICDEKKPGDLSPGFLNHDA